MSGTDLSGVQSLLLCLGPPLSFYVLCRFSVLQPCAQPCRYLNIFTSYEYRLTSQFVLLLSPWDPRDVIRFLGTLLGSPRIL